MAVLGGVAFPHERGSPVVLRMSHPPLGGNASSLLADCRRVCAAGTFGAFGVYALPSLTCGHIHSTVDAGMRDRGKEGGRERERFCAIWWRRHYTLHSTHHTPHTTHYTPHTTHQTLHTTRAETRRAWWPTAGGRARRGRSGPSGYTYPILLSLPILHYHCHLFFITILT